MKFLKAAVVGQSWLATRCPPSLPPTPPTQLDRGRKSNGKKLWVEIKAVSRKKRSYVEAKENIIFSTSHQQTMSSHFLGSRASAQVAVALEEKHLHNKCPPPPPFSSLLLTPDGMVILGQLSQLCPLPTSLPPEAFGLLVLK